MAGLPVSAATTIPRLVWLKGTIDGRGRELSPDLGSSLSPGTNATWTSRPCSRSSRQYPAARPQSGTEIGHAVRTSSTLRAPKVPWSTPSRFDLLAEPIIARR